MEYTIYLHICTYINLSIYLYIYMYINLSIYLYLLLGCGSAVHDRPSDQDGSGPLPQLLTLRRQGGLHQRLRRHHLKVSTGVYISLMTTTS